MKINKKLLAVMMTVVIGGTILTGCGQKADDKPATEQGTTDESTDENVADDNTSDNATDSTDEVVDGTEDSFAEADPTVAQEKVFVITDGIELPASLNMPEEMFADSYGIDPELLESYYVQMPMMNVHATEIAVFEVKDEANIDAVKAGIEKRQEALEAQWSRYLPDQLELVQNAKTAVKGNLVLFVISEEADQIVANFEA